MFGKNSVTKSFPDAEGGLLVNSLWYTIQGEGPDAGCPAVFLRLSKCNLRCHFCDTEFEEGRRFSFANIREEVFSLLDRHMCSLLVITGGEPLLQNVVPLVKACNYRGCRVSIETAGTSWIDRLNDHFCPERFLGGNIIVCSPKTPVLHKELVKIIGAYKYVVKEGDAASDGLPMMSTQIKDHSAHIARPHNSRVPVFLQPCDEGDPVINQRNLDHAVKMCMTYGYRLSVQLHKLAGLP